MIWPLAIYLSFVMIVVSSMIIIPALLGQRHRDRATGQPYESGIVSSGSSQIRFTAHFYLIAMIFVIFDLEAVFIFTWALAAKELGWIGYAQITCFVFFLMVAFVYLWKMGCFQIIPSRKIKESTTSV